MTKKRNGAGHRCTDAEPRSDRSSSAKIRFKHKAKYRRKTTQARLSPHQHVNPAARALATMEIADIKVGERIRDDMGDIEGLAESIEDLGLLNPVTVDEDGRLLAGARRLTACKRLGWKDIPVNVIRCRDD